MMETIRLKPMEQRVVLRLRQILQFGSAKAHTSVEDLTLLKDKH